MGRLPYGTKERDIEKFFRNYGRLREINLKNGYGFVVSLSQLHYFAFQSLLKFKGFFRPVWTTICSTHAYFVLQLYTNLNLSLSYAWTVFVLKFGQLTPCTISPGLPAHNLQAIRPQTYISIERKNLAILLQRAYSCRRLLPIYFL